MFFDTFNELCKKKGVSPKAAVTEIGLSNSLATKWKKTAATPQGDTLNRIANYFGVSVDYLLGKTQENKPVTKSDELTDADIKFALFDGDKGITDAQFAEVKQFARFVRERDKGDKK